MGFTKEKQWTPVSDLSGGERRRLQLLRLLVGEPNVLMLDEPTNDLDTDTLAAVEDVLDGWPGTLVVVSHDRYLLERVTDHQMALLGDGKLRGLPGGVDQYLELREAALASGSLAGSTAPTAGSAGGSAPTSADGPSEAEKREARKDLNRIDRQPESWPSRRRSSTPRWQPSPNPATSTPSGNSTPSCRNCSRRRKAWSSSGSKPLKS